MNSLFRIIQQSIGNIQSNSIDKNINIPFIINKNISNKISDSINLPIKDNKTLISNSKNYKYGYETKLNKKNITSNSTFISNSDNILKPTESGENIINELMVGIKTPGVQIHGLNGQVGGVQIQGLSQSINQYTQLNRRNLPNPNTFKTPEKCLKDLKYWEYGNSGIKIKHFNNIMGKNLSILYYIDKTFSQLLDEKNINIRKMFGKNFSQSYSINSSKIICSNTKVSIDLSHGKISGHYNIIAAGSTIISNIKILPEEIKKFRVPDLNSVLNDLDNIKQIIKLTNILNLYNNFDMKNDFSDPALNFYTIVTNSLSVINEYRDKDKEKKLLKSSSSNALYIKIYDTHGKAFIIDSVNKLIYYITEKELIKERKIILKYYVFPLNEYYKII